MTSTLQNLALQLAAMRSGATFVKKSWLGMGEIFGLTLGDSGAICRKPS